jgi:hypothetical protein
MNVEIDLEEGGERHVALLVLAHHLYHLLRHALFRSSSEMVPWVESVSELVIPTQSDSGTATTLRA